PRRSGTVYAGTTRAGIFRSMDGGATWTALNEGLGSTSVLSLVADRSEATTLYAGTVAGLYRRTDGEARWTMLGGERLRSVTAVAPDPHHVDSLYAGTGGFVLKSLDGGQSWTDLSQWVLSPMPRRPTQMESERPQAPATGHSTRERR
ncbi:MAG: hypothetical protein HYZ81_18315, partial [Nitrospinae bacterium]|nr:hypothetical protein [Nitrospinota bacterium]